MKRSDHPIIGWERREPVPDGHAFNDYLHARSGHLCLDDIDLAEFVLTGADTACGGKLSVPLEIVYLPKIRQRIADLRQVFAGAMAATGYSGYFHYAYASKANAAEEVVRTALQAGAHYEMSSAVDVEIARIMLERGTLTPERWVICNGFKPAGSEYASAIVELQRQHGRVLPVVEDPGELQPLIESGLPFEVGLRQKSYGQHANREEMDRADSRFGMETEAMWETARRVAEAPNLTLRLYHTMVGSQIGAPDEFVKRLRPSIEVYARLRAEHPTLDLFDFGGGVPAPMTLSFRFDYDAFAHRLLTTLQDVCDMRDVPAPDVLVESGRYTTAEHGAHIFKVILVKENDSCLPWYIINGSIMTSFPDSWALSEHFIALPLTHLDRPFRRVRLGGITCDSDDVYPPHGSRSPLYLPCETDELYVGFFGIGAYQEMLGGVRGTKHCVLPEANELIIDRGADGELRFQLLAGQTTRGVLRNLGYT